MSCNCYILSLRGFAVGKLRLTGGNVFEDRRMFVAFAVRVLMFKSV